VERSEALAMAALVGVPGTQAAGFYADTVVGTGAAFLTAVFLAGATLLAAAAFTAAFFTVTFLGAVFFAAAAFAAAFCKRQRFFAAAIIRLMPSALIRCLGFDTGAGGVG